MRLKEKYIKQIIPEMKKNFGYKNSLAVPKVEKVVVNAGLNINKTAKNPKYRETIENVLTRITGQKPVERLAKKSISGFKIRQGQLVGLAVTLRKQRMYDFMERLINITLPRIRDFRGLEKKNLDKEGNFNLGFKEHIVFPEISPNEIEEICGLEIVVVTNTKDREKSFQLLKLLGFPFK